MTRPEDRARAEIDRRLTQAGWLLQDMAQLDPSAGRGVAVREYPTDTGPADYLLPVDRQPVGVIAAKRDEEGQRITAHETLPSLSIALPPVSEMAAIIELVESAVSASVETELSVQAGLRLAAAQRQNILRAAFSGRLVPQDLADEPASALLAHIRAERAATPKAQARRKKALSSPPCIDAQGTGTC